MTQDVRAKLPVATLSILLITALITGLQFVFPGLLPALMRTPAALSSHEWWRFVTPLLVHAEGWKQIAFNFPAILVVGFLTERIIGSKRLLFVYLVCGIVGEVAGLAWKPYGAGASVAGAGVLGALAVCLIVKTETVPAVFGAIVILGGAAVLTVLHDLHGPPILAGAVLAGLMLKRRQAPNPS